jgi:hypothetical protein
VTDATSTLPQRAFHRVRPTAREGLHRCGPRDVVAVATLAARCAWRRRKDAPFIQRILRLGIWPAGAILLALESRSLWVNADRTAMLATRSSAEGHLFRVSLLAAGVVLPTAVIAALAIPAVAQDAVLVVSIALMLLMLVELPRYRRIPELQAARRKLTGPDVVEATNLLAAAPGAGLALARALCATADATGTTIVAKARGAARQRLYRRLGFTTVTEASGTALIVARHGNKIWLLRLPLGLLGASSPWPPIVKSLRGTQQRPAHSELQLAGTNVCS